MLEKKKGEIFGDGEEMEDNDWILSQDLQLSRSEVKSDFDTKSKMQRRSFLHKKLSQRRGSANKWNLTGPQVPAHNQIFTIRNGDSSPSGNRKIRKEAT